MLSVQVHTKARQNYPDPVYPPIPTNDPPNNQTEIDKIQNAEDANQSRLDNAVNERQMRTKENSRNGMANFIKKKLLDQNEATTVKNFCTVAKRQMFFLSFAQVATGQKMSSMGLFQLCQKTLLEQKHN